MSPYPAEFLGTGFLLLLGAGVVANVVLDRAKGHASGWIVISAGWCFAVFAGVAWPTRTAAPT
jgi:glycerol uptake facilitator protein